MAAAILIGPNVVASHGVRQRSANRIVGPRLLSNHPGSGKSYSTDKLRRWRSNRMAEPTKIRAGGGGDDEGVRALKQEAFVSGSSSSAAHGLDSTLNNLSKWIVSSLFGLFLLWRHDAGALWAASGSVINAALSTALKKLFNQERPVANLRSDPGMPSSHAQSIFYMTTLAVLSMVQWWGLSGFTTAIGSLVVASGSYLSWLRISQQFHTINQVVVGALVGTVFSALWFWSWEAIVLKAFESNLWVQIVVILGGAAFCVAFLLHAIRGVQMLWTWVVFQVPFKVEARTVMEDVILVKHDGCWNPTVFLGATK